MGFKRNLTDEEMKNVWGTTWAEDVIKQERAEKQRQEEREEQERQRKPEKIFPERWMCIESHDDFVQGQVYTLVDIMWEGRYTLNSLPFNKQNEKSVDLSKFDYIYTGLAQVNA